MGIFVGQKGSPGNASAPIRKVIGATAVLTRLMMFQAFAAHNVAHRKEKIVMIVMTRLKKLLRLDHQVLVVLQLFWSDFEIGGLVGEDIEVHGIVRPCRKI